MTYQNYKIRQNGTFVTPFIFVERPFSAVGTGSDHPVLAANVIEKQINY